MPVDILRTIPVKNQIDLDLSAVDSLAEVLQCGRVLNLLYVQQGGYCMALRKKLFLYKTTYEPLKIIFLYLKNVKMGDLKQSK